MLERIFSFDTLWWVLMAIYIPACIALIVIVLLQKGKGTGFAGAFGAGAGPGADTVFGPRMSRSLPIRLTYISAAIFMIIAVIMSLIAGEVGRGVAPELLQEEATAEETGVSGALSTLGLGTNRADDARVDQVPPPAPIEDAAVVEPDAEPTEPAPAPAEETAPGAESAAPVEGAAPEAAPVPAPAEEESAPGDEAPISQ